MSAEDFTTLRAFVEDLEWTKVYGPSAREALGALARIEARMAELEADLRLAEHQHMKASDARDEARGEVERLRAAIQDLFAEGIDCGLRDWLSWQGRMWCMPGSSRAGGEMSIEDDFKLVSRAIPDHSPMRCDEEMCRCGVEAALAALERIEVELDRWRRDYASLVEIKGIDERTLALRIEALRADRQALAERVREACAYYSRDSVIALHLREMPLTQLLDGADPRIFMLGWDDKQER